MDSTEYTSPYIKTKYTRTIRFRNNTTGETEEKQINRTVYKNVNIDPDLVIPAGTVMGNETTTQNMTNLERMQAGKSPAILTSDEKGNPVYDKVELHHLTSTERNRGSKYFNGVEKDGTIVEIQSSLHDKYKKQLHAINEKNNSFRKSTTIATDKNGQVVRQRTKTQDAIQYDNFRSHYWVDRAEEITRHQQNTNAEVINQSNQIEEGGSRMGKSWELTPEEKQKAIQGQQKAAEKWNKNSTTSSGTNEGKGERERERTREKGQSR